ncbi:MAG TPA: HD domain-containing protein [Anaeromyxobacteraceae bacterium]|nr:HD domain-containing protein [Anaeromyxobacteraceae bacterium]
MDKTWVKDVKEGERLKAVFLVARKATPTAKSGKTYLAATLHDKTGELEARAFDKIEELGAAFDEKDYVEVEGPIGTFQGKPQLRIETVAKVDPAGLDAAEFIFVPPPEPKKPEKPAAAEVDDALWKELLVLVEAVVDPHVKGLIAAFLGDDDFAHRFRRAAAAKTVHHAYPGGLLEHTVSTIKLAHRLADQYPQVDRDLLVAGAFFHDIGKVRELTTERSAEYTDEGKLVGHLVMTAQWIHDKARRAGVPRDLEHHVVHLVLAHHGKQEYGSPKEPLTLEALLTHYLDEIDSRVNSWLNLMGKDGGNRRWTDSNNVYEQPIWRGALPTVQAEKKGPPAEAMTPVIYVPREGPSQGNRKKPEKKARPAPAQRPERRAEERPAAAEGAAPAAEGQKADAPAAPPRPERPDRGSDRGHRGGPGSFGGPGDKKKGYTGPRLPGDKGPHRPPGEKKSLTHNPFAALAAKLEDGAKPAEAAAPEGAPEPVPEAVEAAPAAPVEPPSPAPAEGAPPAGEGTT